MSILKKPYEISVWEDVIVYVGTDLNEYSSISDMPNGVLVDYLYYNEKKLAIIGSSTMTSPARTTNNIFKKNINGVITLTFDMYYQYEDIDEGLMVRNPLIDFVVNERKVKLYYEDKWYDFIVKKDDEKGRDYKYSFTCTGLAANELGKTGFRIELDTELENNTGTIWELADAVLEGSDWLTIKDNQEVILLTNDEALYLIKLNSNLTGTIRGTNTTITAGANEFIYVYYTSYINLGEDYFQFIYVNKHTDNPRTLILEPDLYDDKITIHCTVPPLPNPTPNPLPEGTYDLYASNIEWNEGYPKFCYQIKSTNLEDFSQNKTNYWYKSGNNYIRCTNESVYSSSTTYYIAAVDVADYRGRRYVRKLLMDYDPVLELTIWKYKGATNQEALAAGIVANKEYYGYTTTEFLDALSVTNYIYNSTNFKGTSYWSGYNNTSLDARVYPDVKPVPVNPDSNLFSSYLVINFGGLTGRAVNEGIILNYSRINKFEKGEKYRFKVWVGLLSNSTIIANSIPFKCVIKKYTLIDIDNLSDVKYFEFNGDGTSVEDGYYIIDSECLESATWRDLDSNIGIFLYPRAAANTNVDYYIKDILLYRYIEDESGNVMDIGDVPEVRVITNYHFYDPAINAGFLSAEDYIFSDNNKDYYIPMYGSGENEFEKIRSITAKESNRFNLLQELSETFECWVRFEIAHESNGKISIEEYYYYDPKVLKPGYKFINNDNEDIKLGAISSSTGKTTTTNLNYRVRHLGYIEISPNTGYKIVSNIPNKYIYWYTDDKTFISAEGWFLSEIKISPSNAKYMRFVLAKSTDTSQTITPSDVTNIEIFPGDFYYYNLIDKDYYELISYKNIDVFYTRKTRKRQSKKVVFYGEILLDNYVGFKYGINLKDNNRTLDSELIVTKIIVKDNTCDVAENGFCSIARAQDNPIKENFALNLDYYTSQGLINSSNLNNDLYLELNGSIGLYPKLSRYNKERNSLIETLALEANSITNLTADYLAAQVTYNEATKELSKLLDPVSGTIVQYTGYLYEDFTNLYNRTEDHTNIPAYGNEVYYINGAITGITPTPSKFCIKNTDLTPVDGNTYYTLENNHFVVLENITKFSSVKTYYKAVNALYTVGTYFETASNTTTLAFTGNNSSEVYIYAAARRIMALDSNDLINDNYTILKITEVVTLTKERDAAYINMNKVKEDLDNVLADYNSIKDKLLDIANATEEIEKEFNTKYSRYIQEGSWTDDNYMDDDLYYLDSLLVLYDSAYPKVSYNFKVLELSLLEGYEAYKFDIGNKTFVEDVEFFGYLIINDLKTPVREVVVVTESISNLDEPDKNDLKVQNYRSHFEDLFQRITAATQSLEYHSGEYGRAAAAITPEGAVTETALQKSFATAAYIIQNSRDQSVVWDDTGILATNLNDPAQVTRLASGGLLVSSDGGQTWGVAISGYGINADYIRAGVIDADKINIMSGAYPTFRWDALGLRAYAFETSDGIIRSYDPTRFVAHDKFGIYGLSGSLILPTLNTVYDVEENANFALTWNGLFIKSSHRDGYVRVSPTEDIALYSTISGTPKLRGKFGLLDLTGTDEIYGLALYAADGTTRTVETKSDGTLWLKSLMDIGTSGLSNTIYIGVGEEDTLDPTRYKVIKVNDLEDNEKFIVYSDGTLKASGAIIEGSGTFTGTINANGGHIGNMTITGLVDTVGIRISPSTGTFKVSNGTSSPDSITFELKSGLEGASTYTWNYGPNPSSWSGSSTGTSFTLNYDSSLFNSGVTYVLVSTTIGGTTYSDRISVTMVEDGEGGVTISSVTYGLSASANDEPSSWSSEVPTTINPGQWLWTRTTYDDNTTVDTKAYSGTNGQDGTNGLDGVSYTYSIESSAGTVINTANITTGSTTTITGRVYKTEGNNPPAEVTLNISYVWYKKVDGGTATLVATAKSFIFDLTENFSNVLFYFIATINDAV